MSDELSTKVSLDLDIDKMSKHLEAFSSGVNEMVKGIQAAQDGLEDLGPKSGKTLKDLADTIGKLDTNLKQLVKDLGNAHGDAGALKEYKAELVEIFMRLSDIEGRMKTALSPDVVNDMMNAVQKVSDVLGRVNLGKLEVSLKEVDNGLSSIKEELDSIVPLMKQFVQTFNSVDSSKLQAAMSQTTNSGVVTEKAVEGMKKEARQAKITREEYER